MPIRSGLTADDLRRQVATQRMGTIMGPGEPQVVTHRQPKRPPGGAVPLERPPPSTAAETGQLVGQIGGTAVGIAVASGINPVLGMILGLGASQLGAGVGRAVASAERPAIEAVELSNRRRIAQASLERQRYERDMERARPELAAPIGMRSPEMPAPGGQIEPGGTDKLKNLLVG